MKTRFTKPFRPHSFFFALWVGIAGLLYVGIGSVVNLAPSLHISIAAGVSTFLLYGIDKALAISGALRIPEAVLLLTTFFGGAPGALAGMYLFRHKTRKPVFVALVAVILMVQIVLVTVLLKR